MSFFVGLLIFLSIVYFFKGVISGKDKDFYMWLVLGALLLVTGIFI